MKNIFLFFYYCGKCFKNLLLSLIGRRKVSFSLLVDQIYIMGIGSFWILVLALVFVSLIYTVEFSYHMKLVLRQDSLVPAFSTVFLLRELGPVITCLLLTSRVGAGMSSEIASMKVSDQLDSLSLFAVDPIDYLVLPRWIGCVVSCVALSFIAVVLGVLGGAFMSSFKLSYQPQEYFNMMFVFVGWRDVLECFVKSFVFGNLIPLISTFHGFQCEPGASGVGQASTQAVVWSALSIFASDFFLSTLFYYM